MCPYIIYFIIYIYNIQHYGMKYTQIGTKMEGSHLLLM